MTHLSFVKGKSYNVHFHKNNVTWPLSANGLCEVTWHTKKTVSHQEPIIWSKQLPNFAVVDPDLQIRRSCGGGSHLDPEISGGPGSKKIFWALWASIWSKNNGGGGTQVPPLDPPLFCAKVILKIYWLVRVHWSCFLCVTVTLIMVYYSHQNLFYVNW